VPYNGSGVFNRVYSWVTDAANGIDVSSSRTDTDTDDIAAGLSNCVTRDGQSPATANIPLGGFKLTGVAPGIAATDGATLSNALNAVCEFRLTLSTGVPVPTTDVTGATTVYCSPYCGNSIALYDGTSWHRRTSSEFSLALGTLTSALPYDVFCYDNAGTPTLEFLAWSSGTARATSLVLQDGVLSKSGATTRRYLGTFYTTSTTQTEDSLAKRYLWNYYNRVNRPMRVTEATDSWNYTTATVRQANGSTANQLAFVVGVAEDSVRASVIVFAANAGGNPNISVGVGLDSTTAFTSGGIIGAIQAITTKLQLTGSLETIPAVGSHYMAWLEYSTATGTTTWYGDNGVPTTAQSGISGMIRA